MNLEKITIEELEKGSLKDLLSLEEKLSEAIENRKVSEKSELLEKINALAESSGYSIDDLFGSSKKKIKKLVKAKYVNPNDSSDTYTGRGRKPIWLNKLIGNGAKLEDFEIK